jgi:hypothetical protein
MLDKKYLLNMANMLVSESFDSKASVRVSTNGNSVDATFYKGPLHENFTMTVYCFTDDIIADEVLNAALDLMDDPSKYDETHRWYHVDVLRFKEPV